MSTSLRSRRRLTGVAAAAAAVTVSAGLMAAPTQAASGVARASSPLLAAPGDIQAPPKPRPGVYVVVLDDLPETAYDGRVPGYPATRPSGGEQFDSTGADVQRYRSYLRAQQDRVLARIGGPDTLYRYTTALSGFSARLGSAQVTALRKMPDVLTVKRDQLHKLETVDSPEFLGLTGPNGVWAQHGGPKKAGKGLVVGIIDTGIWPENPSFAGPRAVPDVPGFIGRCQVGERWTKRDCNGKVISARYFVKAFGADNIAEEEYLSPRDGNGHGSHTAGTAAGNHGVKVTIEGQRFGKASGMAPAAYIASYKALWTAADPDNSGGTTSDLVQAVNRAVRDGVDVINYSISGSQSLLDPVGLAFLGAAAGNIFVATSAGNNGPARGTVAKPSPWTANVAASTHHLYQGAVRLGNGRSYVGAMLSDQAVSERRIILSSDAAQPDADPEEAALCYLGTLDPDKVEGRIVVCDRGVIDRVEKSAAVAEAGGVGMVLVNVEPGSLDADFHSVPTVHIDVEAGEQVKRYVERQGRQARASLDPTARDDTPVPQIAAFSSRGPLPAEVSDILKPDLAAPGVSVVAAVAPPFNNGHKWDLYSGTSMASPHIAGLGAFIQRLRPSWSPAMIKSAMMTTAYDVKGIKHPFAQGAGHVRPKRFLNPGLVYDARHNAWFDILTGQRPIRNLNQASIAVGSMAGEVTVRRHVMSVGDTRERYTASVRGLRGIDVQVSNASFWIRPGHIKKFQVTFTATDDTRFNRWTKGHLVWTGSEGHRVRTPIVVRPVAVAVPEEVQGSGTSGSLTVRGIAGFTGELDLAVTGLEGAAPQEDTIEQGEFLPIASHEVDANTAVARFDLNSHDDADDLDLYIAVGDTIVAYSATGAADERVTLRNPEPATYDVYVHAYAASGDSTIPYTYTGWVVPRGDQGNLEVRPDPVEVEIAEPFEYTASWSGLDADQRYFGFVRYVGFGQRTYVTIN